MGFPFSDSIAEDPTISSSFHHTLGAGLRVADIFSVVASVRKELSVALSAMVSYAIIDRVGFDRFVDQAVEAGFDALIVADLFLEEARRWGSLWTPCWPGPAWKGRIRGNGPRACRPAGGNGRRHDGRFAFAFITAR